jgi:hypothetical protein
VVAVGGIDLSASAFDIWLGRFQGDFFKFFVSKIDFSDFKNKKFFDRIFR